ncbi:MAG: hypothetical protein IPN94_18130 [Sphingobacteriales bacterium]|jgi:hypothetical protein|nr:hypothetical protein [Sphingobacteriales bacterium]
MIIERTPNEIIIRLPLNTKIDDLQAIVNYARYCELTSLFSFKQEEVDDIAQEINSNWWAENRNRFIK